MDVTSDLFFGKVFAENLVIEIVLPFKWVSMYIFLRMFLSDGCFVVNHLIGMDVHLKWVGMCQLFETYVTVLQSGSLQLKGLDFPYQLVQDLFHQQV